MDTTKVSRIGTSATLNTYVCAYQLAEQRVRISFLMCMFHKSKWHVS